nr:MAG TPA: hypothetical protein [Caudoviricetes sp.]
MHASKQKHPREKPYNFIIFIQKQNKLYLYLKLSKNKLHFLC